jgi:hypothetical protein
MELTKNCAPVALAPAGEFHVVAAAQMARQNPSGVRQSMPLWQGDNHALTTVIACFQAVACGHGSCFCCIG